MSHLPLHKNLNIKYPVIQAPMAGVTTADFVSIVSESGVLGNIGAGYLSADKTRQFIRDVKQLTDQPFGINLFVPEYHSVLDKEIETAFGLMKKTLDNLNERVEDLPDYTSSIDYHKQIEVVLDESVPVCSFTFGIPDEAIVKELKRKGTFVIGTATTVSEAEKVEQIGMDAVVAQGSEAGGHRGTFLGNEHLIGTMALVPQVVDNVSIPVIAAGGLMDGRGLLAALSLGAEAAQYGTAFLTTKECGTHTIHKEELLHATEEDTALTKAFSGKSARGINNTFIQIMKAYESGLPPFPYQNAFTRKIRKIAAQQKNKEYMALWSGQAPRLTKDVTVKELIEGIVNEYERTRRHLYQVD